MCAMEDCEHGVRSVNEKAAENYLKEYPHTLDAILDSRKMISDAISGANQRKSADD
jgi:5'-3' exonuclease